NQASLSSHIDKSGVSVIAVEMVGGMLTRWETLQPRAVDHKDIGMIVAIIIKDCHPAASTFKDILLGPFAAVHRSVSQASWLVHIHELDSGRAGFGWLAE